jgi:hypothetical protein
MEVTAIDAVAQRAATARRLPRRNQRAAAGRTSSVQHLQVDIPVQQPALGGRNSPILTHKKIAMPYTIRLAPLA